MNDLRFLDRRFLFITGKGGVGKTTVAAAAARALSAAGRKVLIAVCDSEREIGRLFAGPELDERIRILGPSIWGVRLVPEQAFLEYAELTLKNRLLSRAFRTARIREFLIGIPGLTQWAMLGKAWYHTTELDEMGRRRFDSVVFDAPATGHGIEMLRVPQVILDTVPGGPLRHDAAAAQTLLLDPVRSGLIVVTRAEELPTTEALELCQRLTQDLGLKLTTILVNATTDVVFEAGQRDVLAHLTGLDSSDPGDEALLFAQRRAFLESRQAHNLERLSSFGVPLVKLPWLGARARTPEGAIDLAQHFWAESLTELRES